MTSRAATPAADRDARTLCETTCDLIVIEHRLRDLRRWTPTGTTHHLDQALASVAAALDSLHAEHQTRATPTENGDRR